MHVSGGLFGEPIVIDQQRLQDDAYRGEVLTALLREYQDGSWRSCVTRLGDVVGAALAGGRRAHANQRQPCRWASLSEKQFLQGARPARELWHVDGSQRCTRSAAAPLTCRPSVCREQSSDGRALLGDGPKAPTTIHSLLPPLSAFANTTATISSGMGNYARCLS